MRVYCSTLLKLYSIFISLGIINLLNIRISVCVCISSPPFLVVILLESVKACFPRAVVISSGVAIDKSLFLITPFEVSSLSCG